MKLTINGFLVGYDTSKRLKHSREDVIKLRNKGLSLRQIAKKLDIPFGSIHYILRTNGLTYYKTEPVNKEYITRSQAKYLLDITDSQFDYYVNRYKEECKRVNNKVYIKKDFLEDRVVYKKGYEKLSDDLITEIQDLSLLLNHTEISKELNIARDTVIKYSLRELKDKNV